jgi:uncharacterized protein YkwD
MRSPVWLVLTLLLTACPALKPPARGSELDTSGKQSFLNAINQQRTNAPGITCSGGAGLGYADPQTFTQAAPPLVWNTRLEAAALSQASFLAVNTVDISTGDPHNGAGNGTLSARVVNANYSYSFAGETIAAGQSNATEVAAAWQISTNAHCNIMLDSSAKDIGAAMVTGGNGQRYWVMVVGKP